MPLGVLYRCGWEWLCRYPINSPADKPFHCHLAGPFTLTSGTSKPTTCCGRTTATTRCSCAWLTGASLSWRPSDRSSSTRGWSAAAAPRTRGHATTRRRSAVRGTCRQRCGTSLVPQGAAGRGSGRDKSGSNVAMKHRQTFTAAFLRCRRCCITGVLASYNKEVLSYLYCCFAVAAGAASQRRWQARGRVEHRHPAVPDAHGARTV